MQDIVSKILGAANVDFGLVSSPKHFNPNLVKLGACLHHTWYRTSCPRQLRPYPRCMQRVLSPPRDRPTLEGKFHTLGGPAPAGNGPPCSESTLHCFLQPRSPRRTQSAPQRQLGTRCRQDTRHTRRYSSSWTSCRMFHEYREAAPLRPPRRHDPLCNCRNPSRRSPFDTVRLGKLCMTLVQQCRSMSPCCTHTASCSVADCSVPGLHERSLPPLCRL